MRYSASKENFTGRRVGKLVGIESQGLVKGETRWLFQCDCGAVVSAVLAKVKSGHKRSCGCLKGENMRAKFTKHGHKPASGASPTFKSYQHAKSRCTNPNDAAWNDYGGRGIKMCDRWIESFAHFLEDMGEKPQRHLSIERIDNSRGYEPGNCVWADRAVQNNNTRQNRVVEYRGKLMTIGQIASLEGVPYLPLYRQIVTLGAHAEDAVAYAKNVYRPRRPSSGQRNTV